MYLSVHFSIHISSISPFQDPGVPNSNCSEDKPCPKDVILRTGNGNNLIIKSSYYDNYQVLLLVTVQIMVSVLYVGGVQLKLKMIP